MINMMEKLDRSNAITILKDYIKTDLPKLDWFNQVKKDLKAIVFYGSTAKELNRPDSDLDMLMFMPLEIETQYTKGEYLYTYQGREINLVIRSIERLRELGREQNDPFEAEIFRNCEILYESDPECGDLIKRIVDCNKQ